MLAWGVCSGQGCGLSVCVAQRSSSITYCTRTVAIEQDTSIKIKINKSNEGLDGGWVTSRPVSLVHGLQSQPLVSPRHNPNPPHYIDDSLSRLQSNLRRRRCSNSKQLEQLEHETAIAAQAIPGTTHWLAGHGENPPGAKGVVFFLVFRQACRAP